MDVKQYLSSLEKLDRRICDRIKRLCELDAARMFSAAELGCLKSVIGTSGELTGGAAEVEFNALRSEISEDAARFQRQRRETVDLIKRLNNAKLALVLYKRYVEYKSIKEIAAEQFISCSHTHLLHQRALEALGALL